MPCAECGGLLGKHLPGCTHIMEKRTQPTPPRGILWVPSMVRPREYKCGNCGGEFNTPMTENEKAYYKTNSPCPFCKGEKKGGDKVPCGKGKKKKPPK